MPDGGDQYVTFSAAWFTLSLINAGLAQSKGRSGLNWWFASLFVGPLATLLIVASGPGGSEAGAAPGQSKALLIGLIVVILVLLGLFAFVRLGAG
jgi:hypothetical protein